MIKVLSWNIQQGGGSRIHKIMSALGKIKAQVVVLSEYRNNSNGQKLRGLLLAAGYRYQAVSAATAQVNSVIIASTFPFNTQLFPHSDTEYGHSVIKAEFDAFSVYGMYLPHKKRHRLFDLLLSEISAEKPMILCGDMNTGVNYVDQKGNSFWYADEFVEIQENGCKDAFRYLHHDIREYSWYSHQGNGYRYDHTLVHEDLLPIVTGCEYLHIYRETKCADHSPMLLQIG